MVTSEASMGSMEGADFSFPDNEAGEAKITEMKERANGFLRAMWQDESSNLDLEKVEKILPEMQDKVQPILMHTYFALDNSKVMSFIDKNPIDGVEDVAAIVALVAWPFVRDLAVKYMTERGA